MKIYENPDWMQFQVQKIQSYEKKELWVEKQEFRETDVLHYYFFLQLQNKKYIGVPLLLFYKLFEKCCKFDHQTFGFYTKKDNCKSSY